LRDVRYEAFCRYVTLSGDWRRLFRDRLFAALLKRCKWANRRNIVVRSYIILPNQTRIA